MTADSAGTSPQHMSVNVGSQLVHADCRVVGWYHSHPTFATFPSMIDIANQVTQQNAHKTSTCEPYIAAIVGPYNKKLPTCQSSMTWFYVNHEAGRIPAEDENPLQAGCTPMQLQVRLPPLLFPHHTHHNARLPPVLLHSRT